MRAQMDTLCIERQRERERVVDCARIRRGYDDPHDHHDEHCIPCLRKRNGVGTEIFS